MNPRLPSPHVPRRSQQTAVLWRWIWAAMVVSILVCALIGWLHYAQRQVLGQSIATLDTLRQARIDLAEGLVQVTLAGDPAMPFDREQGLALLDQSIRSFEASAALLDPQDEAVIVFQRNVQVFRGQLAAWRTAAVTPRTVVELSVLLNQLEREANRFDAQLRASLRAQSMWLDRIFVWVLSGAAMLLASICGVMLMLERTARAAEEALRASEMRQQIALQAGQLGTWEWNPATSRVMLDAIGMQLFGVTTDVFTVQEMYAGIHPDDLASAQAALRASIERQAVYDHEFRWQLPDGSLHWLRSIGRPIAARDGSLLGFYGITSDITARKQSENQIRQLNAELEQRVAERTAELGFALKRAQALYAITNDAIASDNLAEALQRAIERASTTIHADRVTMLIFDWETRSIEQFLYAGPGKEQVSTAVDFDELMSGLTGWAVRERQPAISPKNIPDPRESPVSQQRRIETVCGSILVLPLMYLNEVFGTLTAIKRPDEPDFTADDIDLMSALAGQVALAYARMRLTSHLQRANAALSQQVSERTALSQQLERQAERASAMATLSRALAEAGREPQSLFDTVASHTARLVGDACVLNILSHNGQTLEVVALDHVDPEAVSLMRALYPTPYPSNIGLAGQVVQSGQPLLMSAVPPEVMRANLKREYLPYLERFGMASIVIVPLRVHGRVLGTLGASRDHGGQPYTEADQAFLQDLADRAGLAIENARLFTAAAQARVEAERANRAKSAFLANMSHELRTPINAILGYSESLQDGIYGLLSVQQHKAIQSIGTAGQHLLTLIKDILDLSKVEAEQVELQLERVSVREVCQASLLFVREQALKKRLRLGFQLDDQEAMITADVTRLKQMLVNLLSNAVKFTPAGGSVGLVAVVDSAIGVVQFTVQDTGIGIAPENLGRLFQPFSQVDSSLSREYEGTGLGLVLVRRLVELHGGSVTVESEVGTGSRFTIALPYCDTPDERGVGEAASNGDLTAGEPASAADAPRGRILLAEDNEANIGALLDYLHARGYEMMVARDGHEALARVDQVQPQLILMDIQMPRLDGLEAIRRLRAQPTYADVPIIALTALAMPGDEARCLEAGATAYLTKPVQLRTLAELIQQLLAP